MGIRIIDTTLRDGSHFIGKGYDKESIKKICEVLDNSGVYGIEVGHGTGIGDKNALSVLPLSDTEMIKTARKHIARAKLMTVIITGIGSFEDIDKAKEAGIDVLRVGIAPHSFEKGCEFIEYAHDLGIETIAFFMYAHFLDEKTLVERAKVVDQMNVSAIYLTDTTGAMLPDEVEDKVKALKEVTQRDIGIHVHNNLGLAIGNSVSAIRNGVRYVDGTIQGIGPHSGNASVEALVCVLDKMGYANDVDKYKLLGDISNYVVELAGQSAVLDTGSIVLGNSGLYCDDYDFGLELGISKNVDVNRVFEEIGKEKFFCTREDIVDALNNQGDKI